MMMPVPYPLEGHGGLNSNRWRGIGAICVAAAARAQLCSPGNARILGVPQMRGGIDLQGGRGGTAPGVEVHGGLTQNRGCGVGALCGAAAARAQLGGTGGHGKDLGPRNRDGMDPQEGGGGAARGELGTGAAHQGHRRWAWHT